MVEDLTKMINDVNCLAKHFKMVKVELAKNPTKNCLRLSRDRSKDPRVYNIPDVDEVVALIVGDLDPMEVGKDIVVKKS